MNTNTSLITLYGAPWCSDCRRSKKLLDEHGIKYEYVNLEEDEQAAAKVEKINNGYQRIPTIVFPDGSVMVEPTDEELLEKINSFSQVA